MIKLLIGKRGSGKTKDIIKHANNALSSAKGTILFINESDESILEINHSIRYINISDFPINSSNEIVPFLYGLLGTDNDIESIYLDGLFNLYIMTDEEACKLLEKIKILSAKHNIRFEISISIEGKTPECFTSFL